MSSRGRYQSNDWDPMRDDYNNSMYDAQYPDDDAGSEVQLDHTRLYIRNIPQGLNDDGLRAAFSKFGELHDAFVSKDENRRFAIVKYETSRLNALIINKIKDSEAKLAMMKMNRTEPLRLSVSIAHKNRRANDRNDYRDRSSGDKNNSNGLREPMRDDTASLGSRGRNCKKQEIPVNGDSDIMEDLQADDDLGLGDVLDSSLSFELETLRLQQLKLQEQQLACKHRLLMLKQAEKKKVQNSPGSNRRFLPDGRIEVRNNNERAGESRECETSLGAGAGDSNVTTVSSCETKKMTWQCEDDGSSTPSTCVLCSEDTETRKPDKSEVQFSRTTETTKKSDCSKLTETISKRSDTTSKKIDVKVIASKSEMTDFKYSDLYDDTDDDDETTRLIQLRNADYMDIVEDDFKLVVALAGYPKCKMRLQQMALFQKCLNDIIDMQLKAGLLKRVPCFIDYYLNRGALVFICKNMDTRDWMIRISPGLQERMFMNLVLLRAKVKRLCLAVMKISRLAWPATAQDAFKLLQYFNPTLKTHLWKIYAQKVQDDVETTSFLVDRMSGEIIRGPTFKNVVDYDQIEFELTGYTEIYYECLMSSTDDELRSVSSRVKLLTELKSGEPTPKNLSRVSILDNENIRKTKENVDDVTNKLEKIKEEIGVNEIKSRKHIAVVGSKESAIECDQNVKVIEVLNVDTNHESRTDQNDILVKLKDIEYIGPKEDILVWSETGNNVATRNVENPGQVQKVTEEVYDESTDMALKSMLAVSEISDSVADSIDTLVLGNSNLNIDTNKGIAYHRRTNYLDVANELKLAITLEDYPQNKLDGTHIRRLKHLFKEYLHKDMRNQRFTNLIIPSFQDVYLSNGAIIYICDSLETRDYLTEVLPKFIHTTGLKLIFKDLKDLVRYTRIVMRLPKEKAHIESTEVLLNLQSKYPKLKPDCWKHYSDVAGKQKRQFGVDPESLEVIKSPDFDPTFEGEKLIFRIIDRQKRDSSFEVVNVDTEIDSKGKDDLINHMYAPLNPDVINNSLTRIRTNHYSDLIADDLKLYIGPSSYPEARIDEAFFHTIKRAIENVLFESYQKKEINEETIPKFHDIYLFDGVIFIICKDMESRVWLAKSIPEVNMKLNTHLKATEFRGAVGIISMVVQTLRNIDEVIHILQQKNPRLRTKYWRKISTVRSKSKLDSVLQIDKLSAEVITGPNFDKKIDDKEVQFTLGHLKNLIKPKLSLEELTKKHQLRLEGNLTNSDVTNSQSRTKSNRSKPNTPHKSCIDKGSNTMPANDVTHLLDIRNDESKGINIVNIDNVNSKLPVDNNKINAIKEIDPIIIEPDTEKSDHDLTVPENRSDYIKVIVKIPQAVIPDNEDDLNIILDLLEDKNPGLNTEIWKVYTSTNYLKTGNVTLYMDKQSLGVIKREDFDGTIAGERLKFYF